MGFAGFCGPAVSRADGEENLLGAGVAQLAEVGGEGFGGELLAGAVQQDDVDGGACGVFLREVEEVRLGGEEARLAGIVTGDALDVVGEQGVELGLFGAAFFAAFFATTFFAAAFLTGFFAIAFFAATFFTIFFATIFFGAAFFATTFFAAFLTAGFLATTAFLAAAFFVTIFFFTGAFTSRECRGMAGGKEVSNAGTGVVAETSSAAMVGTGLAMRAAFTRLFSSASSSDMLTSLADLRRRSRP